MMVRDDSIEYNTGGKATGCGCPAKIHIGWGRPTGSQMSGMTGCFKRRYGPGGDWIHSTRPVCDDGLDFDGRSDQKTDYIPLYQEQTSYIL